MPFVDHPLHQAHSYLWELTEEAKHKRRREELRDWWKEYLLEEGTEDESGNFFVEFPETLDVYDPPVRGIMAQRRVSDSPNEDRVIALIEEHDLNVRCMNVIEVIEINFDELYACNQEGIISDEEIDSVFDTNITYAITKIKA